MSNSQLHHQLPSNTPRDIGNPDYYQKNIRNIMYIFVRLYFLENIFALHLQHPCARNRNINNHQSLTRTGEKKRKWMKSKNEIIGSRLATISGDQSILRFSFRMLFTSDWVRADAVHVHTHRLESIGLLRIKICLDGDLLAESDCMFRI